MSIMCCTAGLAETLEAAGQAWSEGMQAVQASLQSFSEVLTRYGQQVLSCLSTSSTGSMRLCAHAVANSIAYGFHVSLLSVHACAAQPLKRE